MQMDQHAQVQAQRSMREGGSAGDSPRGRLRSGAPEGVQLCWIVCQILSNPCKSPNPRSRPGQTTVSTIAPLWGPTWSNLVQLGRLVRHVRPSCPIWLLLGSNLVHLCSNLVQLSANLVQLGSILAHPGSNLVQFWSQLGPTWSQNLTKMASPSDLQFSIDF